MATEDWGWTRVAQFPGATHGEFAVRGNTLWVGLSGTDKVYSSTNGTTYVEDALWPGGAPRGLVTFNGFLYAIRGYTQLYRRDVFQWTLVGTAQAENGYVPQMIRMWADDTAGHIMIAGSVYDAGAPAFQHRKARVWSYNEAGGLLVDLTLGTDVNHIVDVCYSDGEWYGSVSRTAGGGLPPYPWRILRRIGAENWAGDFAWNQTASYTPHKFGVHREKAYVRRFLTWAQRIIRKPSSDESWETLATPGSGNSADYRIFYGWEWGGKVLTNTIKSGSDHAYVLNETSDWWYDTGLIVIRIADFIGFETCLYAACDDSPDFAIWRACAKIEQWSGRLGDARSLVCDHQYGDTIYLGLMENNAKPMLMWVDWDFDQHDWSKFTAGSWVNPQTAETRDTCIGYGNLNKSWPQRRQAAVSFTKIAGAFWRAGQFGDDEVITTLEPHPTAGSADLVATRRDNQDWVQASVNEAIEAKLGSWTDMGDIPFVARSQLRVGDDIWIGSETGGSSVVRLLSGGSGNDWVDKGNGLPNVPINDLESA